jgi:galactokinase
MNLQEQVNESFRNHFGGEPDILVRAPGRVNLIGEHTDYNGGFVMPMAINRAMWMAVRYRRDTEVHLLSADFNHTARFNLQKFEHRNTHWCEYIKGVANALQKRGHVLRGWDGAMLGNVPRGSGLSSSAALELGRRQGLFRGLQLSLGPRGDGGGGPGGGKQLGGRQLRHHGPNDFRLRQGRARVSARLPLPGGRTCARSRGVRVVILDTATRRGLVDSAYNERRSQCEEAAAFFGVDLLRDVSPESFFERAGELPELTRRRARHVITEDQRTLAAADAMRKGDVETLGRLMHESHLSLRDDFEVCNDALNTMVECASAHPGCLGARMTGAGFGGCAVALVREDAVADFETTVSDAYRKKTQLDPAVYVTTATDGAQRV